MTPVRVVLGMVVAVGLLAACGGEDEVAKAEEAIAAVLAERLGEAVSAVTVSCPDDAELEPGAELRCTVAIGDAEGQAVDFAVGEEGAVRLATAVIPTDAVETYLAGELAVAAEGPVTADCGPVPLVVQAVGGTIACEVVRTADGVTFDVEVEIHSLDGSVTYTVIPTTTTTTTTTATTVPPVDPAAAPGP